MHLNHTLDVCLAKAGISARCTDLLAFHARRDTLDHAGLVRLLKLLPRTEVQHLLDQAVWGLHRCHCRRSGSLGSENARASLIQIIRVPFRRASKFSRLGQEIARDVHPAR